MKFNSPDPVSQSPKKSQNYNKYSYVLNNPLKYTDPSGYEIIPGFNRWWYYHVTLYIRRDTRDVGASLGEVMNTPYWQTMYGVSCALSDGTGGGGGGGNYGAPHGGSASSSGSGGGGSRGGFSPDDDKKDPDFIKIVDLTGLLRLMNRRQNSNQHPVLIGFKRVTISWESNYWKKL